MNINFLKFFSARFLLAIVPQALPYADEFWQGPEVAHRDVFGYGHLTWEWTRDKPLRSPVYHSIFSVFYLILKLLNLEHPMLIAYGPRIIQCFLSAIYDVYLLKLANLEGITNRRHINLVNFSLWFSLTCFSKSIINSFESVLFVVSFYHWQLKSYKNELICRALVILSIMARPSSIIPWVFIWVFIVFKQPYHLLTVKSDLWGKYHILVRNIVTLLLFAVLSILFDSLYHKKLTWTFYNFLEFNFISGMSDFYGIHQPLWYFTTCIPFLMLGWIFFLLIGLYNYFQSHIRNPELILYTLFYMAILSLSAHKEDRFLLPLFPFFIIFICHGIKKLEDYGKYNRIYMGIKKSLIILGIFTNLAFFVILNTHQDVGALRTMQLLRDQGEKLQSVQFFIQCHRTPYYSYIHMNIEMEFPDCSPSKDINSLQTYQLQANPDEYVLNRLSNYSHLVFYDYFLTDKIKQSLATLNYQIIGDVYHQHLIDTYVDVMYNVRFIVFEKIY